MKTTLLALALSLVSMNLLASENNFKIVSVLNIQSDTAINNTTRYDMVLSDEASDDQYAAFVTCHESGVDTITVECDFRTHMAFGLYCSHEPQASDYKTQLILPKDKCLETMKKLEGSAADKASKIVLKGNKVVGIQ